jgi:hypothetical protein
MVHTSVIFPRTTSIVFRDWRYFVPKSSMAAGSSRVLLAADSMGLTSWTAWTWLREHLKRCYTIPLHIQNQDDKTQQSTHRNFLSNDFEFPHGLLDSASMLRRKRQRQKWISWALIQQVSAWDHIPNFHERLVSGGRFGLWSSLSTSGQLVWVKWKCNEVWEKGEDLWHELNTLDRELWSMQMVNTLTLSSNRHYNYWSWDCRRRYKGVGQEISTTLCKTPTLSQKLIEILRRALSGCYLEILLES